MKGHSFGYQKLSKWHLQNTWNVSSPICKLFFQVTEFRGWIIIPLTAQPEPVWQQAGLKVGTVLELTTGQAPAVPMGLLRSVPCSDPDWGRGTQGQRLGSGITAFPGCSAWGSPASCLPSPRKPLCLPNTAGMGQLTFAHPYLPHCCLRWPSATCAGTYMPYSTFATALTEASDLCWLRARLGFHS